MEKGECKERESNGEREWPPSSKVAASWCVGVLHDEVRGSKVSDKKIVRCGLIRCSGQA